MSILEVLIALALLGTSGVATLRLSQQSAIAVRQAHEAEARLLEASQFMDAVALWPRSGLDQRLGNRPQGPWTLRVDHPPGDVYFLTLSETATGRLLIETAVYRPAAGGAR